MIKSCAVVWFFSGAADACLKETQKLVGHRAAEKQAYLRRSVAKVLCAYDSHRRVSKVIIKIWPITGKL
jgi:hypothetical protein